MKKIIFIFISFIIFSISVKAETIEVKFSSCVDGDTAKFLYKKEIITARFLAIDTPETVHPQKGEQPFGKDASEYTCNKLKNGNKIELEYDEDSDKTDKYDRHLVWVFVDGELLQKELIGKGLASVAYLYGDYKYTDILENEEQNAEDQKIGIWSISQEQTDNTTKETTQKSENNTKEEKKLNYKEIIILIGILVIVCIFSSKARKKVNKKTKSEIKKYIKKRFK